MSRTNTAEADAQIGVEHKCLDHGFVKLIDYMGGDQRIIDSARVSYGDGTKTINENRGLINYMMKHDHGTPFEKTRFEFHVKLPIFLARQWMRHRMGSFNEISARYSVMKDEFYIPKSNEIRGQGNGNKQVGDGELSGKIKTEVSRYIKIISKQAYRDYEALLADGTAREQARMVLPVNLYTEFYWTVDLRNLFGFLKLRLDSHAQAEIREYAKALAVCAKAVAPMAYEAFENHVLNARKFSAEEMSMIYAFFRGNRNCRDRPLFDYQCENLLGEKKAIEFCKSLFDDEQKSK